MPSVSWPGVAGGGMPPKVSGEPGATPVTRAVRYDRERLCAPGTDLEQLSSDAVEILEHHAILDSDVRLSGRVERVAKKPKDRPCINAIVDAQQRQSDVLGVIACKRPEAAMGISILRANPRVQHEGSASRYVVHVTL